MGATATDGGASAFLARHYGPRAQQYLVSPTHAAGPDLDQIETSMARWCPREVLDVGCGGGHAAYRAALHAGLVVACDPVHDMLDVVRGHAGVLGLSNLAIACAAAECLPFAGARFDAVVSRYSAHHWADWEAGLREARRVMSAGGRTALVDTVAPGRAVLDTHLQAIELLRDPSHVRNYRWAEWAGAVERAGFGLASVTPRRLRLDFDSWTARTRVPPVRLAALRDVQMAAPPEVAEYFEIAADGSWTVDTLTLELVAA